MGKGRARRTRRRAVSVGQRTSRGERLRQTAAGPADAFQPAGARGPLGRLPRVVPRLGARRLLCGVTRAEPGGTASRLAPRLPRRSLATSGSVEPRGPSLVPASGASLLGLWLQGGTDRGLTREIGRASCRE